jgi:hypothetical protein
LTALAPPRLPRSFRIGGSTSGAGATSLTRKSQTSSRHRADVEFRRARGRFGERESQRAIPPNERAVMKWNGNPFELDGGDDGHSEDDGAFFLLP